MMVYPHLRDPLMLWAARWQKRQLYTSLSLIHCGTDLSD